MRSTDRIAPFGDSRPPHRGLVAVTPLVLPPDHGAHPSGLRWEPFYAIELARAIDEHTPVVDIALPRTLTDVVRARIGNLDPDVRDALLAASCMASPTVELVSSATISDDDRLIEILENAESKGIIAIDGHRIQFAHP